MNYKEYLEHNIKQIIHECERLEPPYHVCFTHENGALKHLINPEPQDMSIVELFRLNSIMELLRKLDFDIIDEKLAKLSDIEHHIGQQMDELISEIITIQGEIPTYIMVDMQDYITTSVDSSWINDYTCLGEIIYMNLPAEFLNTNVTEEQIDARCDAFARLIRKLKGE